MSDAKPPPPVSEEHPGLERKLLAAVIRYAPVGISISEAPSGRIVALSEKAKELLGRDETGMAIERYAGYPALHPDGRPFQLEDYPTVRAMRFGEVIEKQDMLLRVPARSNGDYRRLEISSAPIRDRSGDIVATVTIIDDVEDRRRAEERLRLVTRATNDAVMDWDLKKDRILWNEAIRTVFGYDEEALDVPGRWWAECIHPGDAEAVLADREAALANGAGTWAGEYRFRRADGSYAYVVDRALIVRENSEARRVVGSLLDITARKNAEAALRESEERLRQFGEASSDVLWIVNAEDFRYEYVSPAFTGIYGRSPDSLAGAADCSRWAELILPEDRAAVLADVERVRAGERITHEFRISRPDGSIRWMRSKDFPLLGADGRVKRIAGIGRDVTEEKRASDRQAMLLAELQHRVRNILAMIRSVARRAAKASESVGEYSAHLESIVASMARVQALLTSSPGDGVEFGRLLREELAAHCPGGERFACEGPPVPLSSKAAEVLTLAVHELATNSVKYGALSGDEGGLRLTWEATDEAGTAWLRFAWTETGIVPPDEPRRQGFGTELVTRRVPFELGGRGAMAFEGNRLVSTIEFPLLPGDSILQTDAASLPKEKE